MRTRSLLEGLVSPTAAALYHQILAGTQPPPDLSQATESDDVRELVEKGLLHSIAATPHLVAVAPERAVEHLVLATQHDLTDRMRMILAAREDAYALQQVYDEQRAASRELESVTVFDDPESIAAVSHDVWVAAHDEIASFHTPHFPDPSLLTDERAIDVPSPDMAGRVRMRGVYDRAIFEIPGTMEVLRRVVAAGVEVRLASSLPLKMIIVDRRVSLLPLDACARQVVRIRSAIVAAAHMAHFEQVWQQAVPYGAVGAMPDSLTPLERSVLTAVAAGVKDEAAARQLEISTRTLRRHVTALQVRFGVDNRISLAVAAAQAAHAER